eukprot:4672094-Pyramimonas_sp.AAC.1
MEAYALSLTLIGPPADVGAEHIKRCSHLSSLRLRKGVGLSDAGLATMLRRDTAGARNLQDTCEKLVRNSLPLKTDCSRRGVDHMQMLVQDMFGRTNPR